MKVFNLLLASAPLFLSSTDGFAPVVRNKSPTTTTTTILQAEIGDTGVAFENVAREWRCKVHIIQHLSVSTTELLM